MEICIKWNVCRVCLLEEKTPSDDEGNKPKGQMMSIFNDTKLVNQIYECSGVMMKPNDCLPEKICRKCLCVLKYAINFRTTCRKSDEYLQSVVNKTKSASSLFKPDRRTEEETLDLDDDILVEVIENDQEVASPSVGEKRKAFGTKFQLEECEAKKSRMETPEIEDAIIRDLRPLNPSLDILGGGDNCENVKLIEEESKTDTNPSIEVADKDQPRFIDLFVDEEHIEIEDNDMVKMPNNFYDEKDMLLKSSSECSVEEESYAELSDEEENGNMSEDSATRKSYIIENGETKTSSTATEDGEEGKENFKEDTISSSSKKHLEQTEEFFYILNEDEIKQEQKDENVEYTSIELVDNDDDDTRSEINPLEAIDYLDDSVETSKDSMKGEQNSSPNNSIVIAVENETEMSPSRRKVGQVSVFVCDVCGNNFTNRSLLNYHMRVHRNERNYECELCYKRFNAVCNLTAHMRVHTGEKPFECQFCGRRFADRSTHIKHERIHTNEKPFQCNICEKSFSLSTSLRAHEKIHTGEKPYKCEPCDKCFKLPHQLKAHLNTHLHKLMVNVTSQLNSPKKKTIANIFV